MKETLGDFRIGTLAKKLGVEKFVIRFWEKEFNIRGKRSLGGQRCYEEKDFETFQLIKELLYEKGFTITGAKKLLETTETASPIITISQEDLKTKINAFKKELLKLRARLE